MTPAIPERVTRFDLAERVLHWSVVVAALVLGVTGMVIWRDLDKWKIHDLNVTSLVHLYLGGGILLVGVLAYFALRSRNERLPGLRLESAQRLALRFNIVLFTWLTGSGGMLALRKVLHFDKPFKEQIAHLHFFGAVAVLGFFGVHLAMLVARKNRGLVEGMLTGSLPRELVARRFPTWLASYEARAQAALSPDSRRESPSPRS